MKAVISKNEQKEDLKSLEEYKRAVLSSRESALKFMYDAGITTKSGKLTAHYK
jgi:hypothetical protein